MHDGLALIKVDDHFAAVGIGVQHMTRTEGVLRSPHPDGLHVAGRPSSSLGASIGGGRMKGSFCPPA